MNSSDKSFQRLAKFTEQTDIDFEAFLIEQSENYVNHMEDAQTAFQAAEQYSEEVQQLLEQAADAPGLQQLDIRQLSLLHKQFTLTAGLSRQEYFEVPMKLENRFTRVRVQFRHEEDGQQGSLDIRFSSEQYSEVHARFRMDGEQVEGYLVTDSRESLGALQKLADGFVQALQEQGKKTGQITVTQGDPDRMDTGATSGNTEHTGVSDKALYHLAKTFLGQLQ